MHEEGEYQTKKSFVLFFNLVFTGPLSSIIANYLHSYSDNDLYTFEYSIDTGVVSI